MTAYEALLAKLMNADHADDILVGSYVDELEDDTLWPEGWRSVDTSVNEDMDIR